jgi:CubicO group peptidase (beta-lactamase class C family)
MSKGRCGERRGLATLASRPLESTAMHLPIPRLALAAFLAASAAFVQASAPADAEVRHPAIDRLVRADVAADAFRGVVLVASGDRVVHHAAYGEADADAGRVNTTATAFQIGSLTKSFTAVTVMQLVDEGLLDLNAPISRYLPGLDRRLGDALTLHILLKQRSGLPVHLEHIAPQGDERATRADLLALINRSTPGFAPDSRHEYSNLNYHLAAMVIEAATGQSFGDVLQARSFGPLRMTRSGVEAYGAPPAHRALGYRDGLLGWRHVENNMSYTLGSGEIYATAEDLWRWSRALDDPDYVPTASRDRMFDGGSEADGFYGYGFRIQPYARADGSVGTLVRHGGSMDGFLSNLHRYLDDDLTVIVLGNQRPFDIRDLTRRIKAAALGMPASAGE